MCPYLQQIQFLLRHSTDAYVPFTPQNTALLENQADMQAFKKLPVTRLWVFMAMKFHVLVFSVIVSHPKVAGTNVPLKLWYPHDRLHSMITENGTAVMHKSWAPDHPGN
jgi:hypothetical protein